MPSATPFRVAVICTVYNEAKLLPLWLTYYGLLFGLQNLYLVDDGSTDGSTDNLGAVNVIRIDQPEIDQELRCRDISFFHNAVLRHYDAAIYVDIDEFLVVDPLLGMDLKAFIQRTPLEHFNAIGLNVLHNTPSEPEYTPSLGVLEQRRFVQFERAYCKQLIHKAPAFWSIGFHNTTSPVAMAAGLYLFHLRAMDLEISRTRIRGRNQLEWSKQSLSRNLGWQNRLDEDAYLSRFFIFDSALFEAALPVDKFNTQMVNIASRVQSPLTRSVVFERDVLTLPPRFMGALPQVRDLDFIAARNLEDAAPARPDIDPDQVYHAAVQFADSLQNK